MAEREYYDHIMEQKILSILIREPSRIYAAVERIAKEMFSSKIHEKIFEGLITLAIDRNTEPPVDLIIAHLEDVHNDSEVFGGRNHIYTLAGMTVDVNNIDLYIKEFTDMYKSRTLLIMGNTIPTTLANNSDVGAVVSDLKKQLSSLETTGVGKDVIRVRDILKEVYDGILFRADNPGLAGISTGLTTIDNHTGGFVGGDLWIIGARPSMGKTTFIIRTLVDLAKRNVPTLIISREMGTVLLMERILSAETGIHFQDIRFGRIDDNGKKKLENKIKTMKDWPLYFDANLYGDINYITGIVRKYVKVHGVKVIGLDYIQLLANRDQDQTAELGRISRALKLLAEDLRITILVASQLNRELERRENKKPILSDLRQSGNLEEDADIVFGLYRRSKYETNPVDKEKIEFLCLKQRNGPLGVLKLRFDENTVTINDPKNISEFLGGDIDGKQAEEKGNGLGNIGERITESSIPG